MSKKQLNGMVRGFVCSLLAVFISCSEKDLAVTDGEEITTSVTVEVPEVFRTRAVPAGCYSEDATSYPGESGYPSIGNVDLHTNPLTFTVAVYVKKTVEGKDEYIEVDKQGRTNVKDDKADFNFRLMKGQTYQIVAYADFSGKEQENLDDISIAPELNDELKDAFFVSKPFEAADNLTVVLKRPFGKLRLIARDFSTFAKGGVLKIEEIKVKYKETVTALATNSFNAITGEFNEIKEGIIREFTADPVIYLKEHEGEEPPYAAVFTMYLPVNFGTKDTSGTYDPEESGNPVPQSWMHPFDIEVKYKNASGQPTLPIKRSFDIDIPIKRNWLTTIDATDFWTDNSRITVSIDHRFEGFINMEPEKIVVNNFVELRDAFSNLHTAEVKEAWFELGKDIDATYSTSIPLGYYYAYKTKEDGSKSLILGNSEIIDGVTVHLDLKGHKIYTRDVGANNSAINKHLGGLFVIYGDNTLIINDSDEEAKGMIDYCSSLRPMFVTWKYGGNIIINGGRFFVSGNEELIYLSDNAAMINAGKKPSSLKINSGWFENKKPTTDDARECLINLWNGNDDDPHPNGKGLGHVEISGGSFVDFNPANGDNITGTMTNQWVDDDHTVLTETVDGKTVYTVIPKNSPEYHD